MYQNTKTIKVGTFNLMNLMLPNKPLYHGTLFCSQEDYVRKAEWIDFMMTQMDADIIGFQELFQRNALVNIFKDNPLYRKAKLYMADEVGDQPRVALLSRYPVENIEVFTNFPEDAIIDFSPKGRDYVVMPFTTFSRPILRADIRIPEYGVITCFVIHLKSKRAILYEGEDEQNPVDLARGQSRSLIIRAAEAVAARALIAEAMRIPDRPVIVCGDINDVGNAVTSRILTGEVPQHRLADQVKKQIWDVLLYHVKDIQARRSYQDFYYTHIHNGMYESLDHIMVSQELVPENPRNTGRVGLVSVYNDHLIDQTFTEQRIDKAKSDHGVVVCSLELDLDRAAQFIPKGDVNPSSDVSRHVATSDSNPRDRRNPSRDEILSGNHSKVDRRVMTREEILSKPAAKRSVPTREEILSGKGMKPTPTRKEILSDEHRAVHRNPTREEILSGKAQREFAVEKRRERTRKTTRDVHSQRDMRTPVETFRETSLPTDDDSPKIAEKLIAPVAVQNSFWDDPADDEPAPIPHGTMKSAESAKNEKTSEMHTPAEPCRDSAEPCRDSAEPCRDTALLGNADSAETVDSPKRALHRERRVRKISQVNTTNENLHEINVTGESKSPEDAPDDVKIEISRTRHNRRLGARKPIGE